MTPKEKAIELYNKMCSTMPHHSTTNASVYLISQQCALIAVDEIIKANPYEVSKTDMDSTIDYWMEVKQEIEKL